MTDYQHFEINWQSIEIEIRYAPDWLGMSASGSEYGTAHLEIEQPGRNPLPVTETGYRSHFTPAIDIEDAGGPVAYAVQWLDWAARDPQWLETVANGRQLALL
jgi:hypothetical protein